jgi:RNA polymerase primary sigma factor
MDKIDSDQMIRIYLLEIGRVPLLNSGEEIELAQRVKQGDQTARTLMIKANLRLVVSIAKGYRNMGLPFLDLVSEGNIGLIKGVERFDPAKGAKLSTYASRWIRQSIQRAIANQGKTIRLPIHLVERISKLRQVILRMSEELGREPADEEVAAELGTSRNNVSRLQTICRRLASLDAPVGDEQERQLVEIVPDENTQTPFELLRDKDLQSELQKVMAVLDDRERRIILERYGLDGSRPQTLEEIGMRLSLTRERIRQVQNIALNKLRRCLQKREEIGHPEAPYLGD